MDGYNSHWRADLPNVVAHAAVFRSSSSELRRLDAKSIGAVALGATGAPLGAQSSNVSTAPVYAESRTPRPPRCHFPQLETTRPSSFSIAAITRASVGSISEAKLAAIRPSRPIRYLWKFQRGRSSGRSAVTHL